MHSSSRTDAILLLCLASELDPQNASGAQGLLRGLWMRADQRRIGIRPRRTCRAVGAGRYFGVYESAPTAFSAQRCLSARPRWREQIRRQEPARRAAGSADGVLQQHHPRNWSSTRPGGALLPSRRSQVRAARQQARGSDQFTVTRRYESAHGQPGRRAPQRRWQLAVSQPVRTCVSLQVVAQDRRFYVVVMMDFRRGSELVNSVCQHQAVADAECKTILMSSGGGYPSRGGSITASCATSACCTSPMSSPGTYQINVLARATVRDLRRASYASRRCITPRFRTRRQRSRRHQVTGR